MQRRPRNVPPSHALAWYGEAMRVWKRAPLAFCGLALVILAANLGLNLLPVAGLVAVYGVGMLVSLPLTFVPFAALFDGAGFRHAFAQSYAAFARNPLPLLLYGALSVALLMLGLATNGVGLLLALPWSAVSSYAAWKDIFAVS